MKGVWWWWWEEGGYTAFIFSASHVIFIVNKTHLALLSEQGLVREASFHRGRPWCEKGKRRRAVANRRVNERLMVKGQRKGKEGTNRKCSYLFR